jgi:hypothetical protein
LGRDALWANANADAHTQTGRFGITWDFMGVNAIPVGEGGPDDPSAKLAFFLSNMVD